MRLSRTLTGIMAAVIASSGVAMTPTPVAAGGDQLQTSGVSTYELQPSRHTIHVTTVFTLVNKAPSKSRRFDCSYYVSTWYGPVYIPATCTRRTNYYYNAYNFGIEKDATKLKVKASSGSASIKPGKVDGDWRTTKVKMSPLWYGKTRKLTVSYDLPAGGPRSTAERKAGYAYADFCAFGPGADKGQVRVVVPSGYTLSGTGTMAARTAGGKTTYTSAYMKSKPWSFSACVSGANKDALNATSLTTPAGRTFSVEAWKDDPAWAASVTTAITRQLPKLEAVLGGVPDPTGMVVREARSSAAGGSRSSMDDHLLLVGEDVLDPAAVTDALAGAIWLPEGAFGSSWLQGGYLAWAGTRAGTSDLACTEPGEAPAGAMTELTRWVAAGATASDAARALWVWKQQAACSLMSRIEAAIGQDEMLSILGAIREDERAWPMTNGAAPPTSSITWKDWLDLVTERGLVPAGADTALLDEALVRYGITTDAGLLAERQTALAAYHAFLSAKGRVPAFITEQMRTWDYAAATVALATMQTAFDTVARVETVLPQVETEGGPVELALTTARTQADLDAAVVLAEKQVTLAQDVASAFTAEAAPRDTFQDLGLAGTTPTDHAPAVEAVATVDETGATGHAQQIRATIDGARDTGTQRAALVGGGVLGILLLAAMGVFVVRRRASRVAMAAAIPAPEPPAPPEPPEPAAG